MKCIEWIYTFKVNRLLAVSLVMELVSLYKLNRFPMASRTAAPDKLQILHYEVHRLE